MKTLVAVDLQKDFYAPDGRLSVSGADALPAKVAEALKGYDAVIFTLDWHPLDHCSFAPQGGPWPVHCVAYSDGAALPTELLAAAGGLRTMLYLKGRSPELEEYGAFNELPVEMKELLDESDEIVVCGLCGDYCVGESVKRLIELGYGGKLGVDLSLTGSIDDGSVIRGIIRDYNLKCV